MTREELNEQIEELEKLRECVSDASLASAALLVAANTLKDIRDNRITEPKKYRIRINNSDLPIPLYLCDVCGDTLFAPENDQFLAYRVTKDKNYAAAFTKKFIMDNFKNYLAIDWDKALEPVEE